MFTGIVEELGTLVARDGARLRIGARLVLDDAVLGASIAVDGCCLTVVAFDPDQGWWDADVTDETLARTTLGARRPGEVVNLERPVRAADRLGGHVVQGHVDGVGTVVNAAPDLVVACPDGLARYVVEKGSVTVDGVSLTVVDAGRSEFSVAVIPHTAAVTTLGVRTAGDRVNLEVDITAKYVERMLVWKDG